MTDTSTLDAVVSELSVILDMDESEIEGTSSLSGELGVDSLDLLQLLVALRNRFGIDVKDGDAKEMIGDLANFLPEDSEAPRGETLSDDELAEIRSRLMVSTVADFVDAQMKTASA